MAKEEKEKPKDDGKEGEKKSSGPKKHLHRLSFEVIRDHKGKPTGETIEHHTYKTHPTDHHTEPERPVGVHDSPEEAGESATSNLGQAMGQGAEPDEAQGAEPGADAGGGAAPAAGM